jgi:hypothetical protein
MSDDSSPFDIYDFHDAGSVYGNQGIEIVVDGEDVVVNYSPYCAWRLTTHSLVEDGACQWASTCIGL